MYNISKPQFFLHIQSVVTQIFGIANLAQFGEDDSGEGLSVRRL